VTTAQPSSRTELRRTTASSVGYEPETFRVAEPSLQTEILIGNVDTTLQQIEAVLARLETKTRVRGDEERNLGLLLRLTAAWLEGMSSEEVASVLGWQISSLQRALHGERKVQASQSNRLILLSEIAVLLSRVVEREAIGDWFRTAVPALQGLTPMEALRRRRGDEVRTVVASYLEPVFG
jgi:hypothetical protein